MEALPEPCDLRALDPPEPLLRILEQIQGRGHGPLLFLLSREPFPIYPLLAAAGWRHRVRRGDNGFELTVFRDPAIP